MDPLYEPATSKTKRPSRGAPPPSHTPTHSHANHWPWRDCPPFPFPIQPKDKKRFVPDWNELNVGLSWKFSLIVEQNIFNTFLLASMQIKTGARIICLIGLYRKMGISTMLHLPGGPHATQAIFYRNGWRFSREGCCFKKNCKESPKGDRSYLDQWASQELRAHLWKMTCGSPYPSYSPSIIHAIPQGLSSTASPYSLSKHIRARGALSRKGNS